MCPSSHWVLMRVDSCPHLGLEGSPSLALPRGLQPEALRSCLTDKHKIAADEFFRTTLGLPVVANCELMCWAFWAHALLIWVCLVYKKPISPPTTYFLPTLLKEPQFCLPRIPHVRGDGW